MDITAHKGGLISYHDPYIPQVKTNEGREYNSTDLSAETLQEADVVVLTTNHNDFDVEFIQQHAKLIVDLRNMMKDSSEKVVKL